MKLLTFKKLLNESFIYGLGGILAKSVAFFTIPIYTSIFNPSEYGTIEMLSVISCFIGSILSMGLDSAQSFYFFKHKKEDKKDQAQIISSILQWRLFIGIWIVVLATVLSPFLNTLLFDHKISTLCFGVSFFSVFFAQVVVQSTEVLRLLYRPWSYVLITTTQSLLAAALILYFVIVLNQNILGFFIGSLCASIMLGIVGWYLVREYIDFKKLHFHWWPKLIRFGAPLVPASLGLYFMSSLDRWFILHYHGADALGLYAIGAKFSLIVAMGVEMFRKAWWPIAMESMHGDHGPETFRMISRFYIGVGIIALIILTLISPVLIKIFTTEAYNSAWPIIGILGWQSIFYGFFLIAAAGLTKVEKTYLYPILMGSALIIGAILNWILVPRFGIIGASLATAITYLVWILVSMLVSEKFWSIGLLNRIFFGQIFIGIMASTLLLACDIHIAVRLISSVALILVLFRSSIEPEIIELFKSKLVNYYKK